MIHAAGFDGGQTVHVDHFSYQPVKASRQQLFSMV
jgi:hypothetical protein